MERDWIIELKEELKREKEVSSDGNWKKTSIYKVPVHAAKLNKRAYSPWVAAIGPYHRGEAQLHRMEDDKKRALRRFLHRAEHKAPEEYVEALDKVVGDLRDAYAHLDHDLKQDEKGFLLLMITDGCFVLETMLADHESPGNAAADDLIFSDHGRRNVIPCIKRDMLLIENQVPLLLLETLVAVNQDLSIQVINSLSLTLRLPTIDVDDTSESKFMNMVAYERLHIGAGNEISSYIYFMNGLVRDERDVRLLKREGIITSVMSSDKDVAKLFLKLSNELLFESDTWLAEVYTEIHQSLERHFEKEVFKWRYHLIHTYFKSPWAIISVIAAATALALSIGQLTYARRQRSQGTSRGAGRRDPSTKYQSMLST